MPHAPPVRQVSFCIRLSSDSTSWWTPLLSLMVLLLPEGIGLFCRILLELKIRYHIMALLSYSLNLAREEYAARYSMQFNPHNLKKGTMTNLEINVSNNQINNEIGLGRTRTEMNPTPTGIIQQIQVPTAEEESILEELGLGRNSHSNERVVKQNSANDPVNY